jgi:hypothetical protein
MKRIAIFLQTPDLLRYIEPQLVELCEAGNAVHLAIQQVPITDVDGLLESLTSRFEHLSFSNSPERADNFKAVADELRSALDYVRYFHPDYRRSRGLRERAAANASPFGWRIARWAKSLGMNYSATGVNLVLGALRATHDALPPDAAVVAYLESLDPDLVILTSLAWPRSPQAEYVLGARHVGVPTAYIVNSWDTLSNKGDIKAVPDRVLVWNSQQAREAKRFHGVKSSQVVVTGAPLFDRWFDRAPTETRAAFCKRVGLPDDKPFILYVCSSPRIAPDRTEVAFVRRWIRKLRGRSTGVSGANLLVRPHPDNSAPWQGAPIGDDKTSVYPTHGRWVVRKEEQEDYFNALYYCSAVMGINTTAMVEAAIVGAKAFTLENGDFLDAQAGTIHFSYLTRLGIARSDPTYSENLQAISDAIKNPAERNGPLPGVLPFVRPQGADQPSTALAVAALIRQASSPHTAHGFKRSKIWGRLLRWLAEQPASSSEYWQMPVENVGWIRGHASTIFSSLLARSPKLIPQEQLITKTEIGSILNETELKRFRGIEASIADVLKGSGPIFVGPWISEVGFETLYWIPFIRWLKHEFKIPTTRLVIISRGGASSWYGDIGSKYFDVFKFYSPYEFVEKNLERVSSRRGNQKQRTLSKMERKIYGAVAEELGVTEYTPLHPAMMYSLFSRHWKDTAGISSIRRYTRYEPIVYDAGEIREQLNLPDRYIVVKFYSRESFPDTPENRAVIADVVETVSRSCNVVVISSSMQVDDHKDFAPTSHRRVTTVDPMSHPASNLDLQTAIIAGADAYIGTYGGMTYVANLLGKTTICFDEGKFNRHTEVAKRMLCGFGGSLYVVGAKELTWLKMIFGGTLREVAASPPTTSASVAP